MRLGSCRGWHVKHGDARTQGLWHIVKDVIHTHGYLHLIIEGLNHRQIAQYILRQLAAEVGIVANIQTLGRHLKQIAGLERRVTRYGTDYLVKRLGAS